MGEERWFCRGDADWSVLAERLKQTACPHCKVVGTLIRHGFLYGFDEQCPPRKTQRARRLFCSNRQARCGCGRTVTVWRADKLRRLSVTTGTLWRFLRRAVADGVRAALRTASGPLSDRTWQRLWKRFHLAQSRLRTALTGFCPPPQGPAKPACRPAAAQVLAHLAAAFPDTPCPIAAFQQTLRIFFV